MTKLTGIIMSENKLTGSLGVRNEINVDIIGTGARGKSAYESWLDLGNEGTEQEYLASLKGEQGIQGEPGEQGIQGEPGAPGDKGDKGETGEQGIQGPKGDKGDTGEQGIQGPKGDDGYTPVKGTDYYTDADKTEMVEAVTDAIPNASNSVWGLVRVGTPANGEMSIGNTSGRHILRYPVTNSTGINNRKGQGTQYGGVIDASNFDLAVKAAMTDGVGAAWTEVEQIAARARMGSVSLQEVLDALPVYDGEVESV